VTKRILRRTYWHMVSKRCRGFLLPISGLQVQYGNTVEGNIEKNIYTFIGPKRDEVAGNGENYIMWSLMICTAHHILFV